MSNRVEIILDAVNRSEKAFATLLRDVQRTADGVDRMAAHSEVGGRRTAAGFSVASGGVAAFLGKLLVAELAVVHIGRLLNRLVFNFNATLETAALGTAASFVGAGQYIDDVTGKALEGQQALAAAQGDSARMMEELQVANFATIATLDQLVRAYQETLPVAMARGFDTGQVKEFTVAMVQAAGAIGVSLDMLGEETRSILTGAINPRTSRIATVLGLTNEQVAQYKGDADALFTFLMHKLDAYRYAGIESQKTWAGVWSNTLDIFNQLSAKVGQPIFEGVKADLKDLADSIVHIDQKSGDIEWDPDFAAGIEKAKDGAEALYKLLSGIVKVMSGPAAEVGEGWLNAITLLSNLVDKIDKVERLAPLLDQISQTMSDRFFGAAGGAVRLANDLLESQAKEKDYAGVPIKMPPRLTYVPNAPPADSKDLEKAAKAAEKAADAAFKLKLKYAAEEERMRAESAEADEADTLNRLRGEKLLLDLAKERTAADRRAREAAIDQRLAEIDLAERLGRIDRTGALAERLELNRELLEIQQQHLAQLDKIKDAGAWYAQSEAVQSTRADLAKLALEQERLNGSWPDGMQRGMDLWVRNAQTSFEAFEAAGQQTAEAVRDSFSDVFFDAFQGELKTAEDYFAAWGRTLNRILADALAEMTAQWALAALGFGKSEDKALSYSSDSSGGFMGLISNIGGFLLGSGGLSNSGNDSTGVGSTSGSFSLGSQPPPTAVDASQYSLAGSGSTGFDFSKYSVGKYHDGGRVVPRFHFGGLSSDEVPAVLQTDERVFSREHSRMLENIAAAAGQQSGGTSISVPVTVQGGDKRLAAELREGIEQLVTDIIRRQT